MLDVNSKQKLPGSGCRTERDNKKYWKSAQSKGITCQNKNASDPTSIKRNHQSYE